MHFRGVFSTAYTGILTFCLLSQISSIGGGVNDFLRGGVCGKIGIAIGVMSTFVSLT